MQAYRNGKITLVALTACFSFLQGMEARAGAPVPRSIERDSVPSVSPIDNSNGRLPQPNAFTFTGGTHVDSATITNGGVVQSNPSFTTTGAVSTNPPANAVYNTAAPTSQSASSTVAASFDGVATFTALLTSSVTANRPTSSGNSEFGKASSTYTFTLTSPTNFQLTGNGSGSVMGNGSSIDFIVTLSEAIAGVIVGNGDLFVPFSFSGTLPAGNYTIAANIASNGFGGSTNPTLVAAGNYTLALVPEPGTSSLIAVAVVGLLLFYRRRLVLAE